MRVERDHHRRVEGQRLQLVQPVTDADRALAGRGGARQVIPGGPDLAPARHQLRVGMQPGGIGLVAYAAEDGAFVFAGVRQHGQRGGRVRGQHHGVEGFRACRAADEHRAGLAPHRAHGAAQPAVGQGGGDLVDILARAARHRAPLRPVAHLQQAVIEAKTQKGGGRKAQDVVRRTGPDCGGHRQQVGVAKARPVALALQQLAQRQSGRAGQFEEALRMAVEMHDVAQHAQERWRQRVGALGKHGIDAGARPFQRAAVHRHAKRHVAGNAGHAQFGEQRHQVRIGMIVIDQKAGVDAVRASFERDIDGMSVAAQVVVRLEQHHVMLVLEEISAGQPGDAGADDGNTFACGSHGVFFVIMAWILPA